MMWKVNRESILLLGGRGALLMQLAHPLVAAGVAEHSDFRGGSVARLRRTLDSMLSIVFGDVETAREVASRIGKIHSRVNGIADDGRAYSARDPQLLHWVHATLTDSSLRVYEACVQQLTAAERARYFDECQVISTLFGVPHDHLMGDLEEMRAWMRSQIASGEVHVTPLARELAAVILNPVPLLPNTLARRADFITPALLPRPIREGYGLKLSRSGSLVLGVGRTAARRMWPLLPEGARAFPLARTAEASS